MTERLLCVDDDADACELLAASLRQLGYQTECITSPAEALELVVAKDFHAVVSDLGMDETDRGPNAVYKKSEVFPLDVKPSVEVSLRKWKARGLLEITRRLARLGMATNLST